MFKVSVSVLALPLLLFLPLQSSLADDLPRCPSGSSYWDSCRGTYLFPSDSEWAGDSYTGDFKNNQMHGQGTYRFSDGGRYVGAFLNDNFHGEGRLTFSNGDVYYGDWAEGLKNGAGVYEFTTGEKYAGEWKNDNYHGRGTYTYGNGDVYSGDFVDGDFSGRGTFTFGPESEWAGDRYVGDFLNDKMHGEGTYSYANGDRYIGGFADDLMDGKGTFITAAGDRYVGDFKDDAFTGVGEARFADGTSLEGIWDDWEYQGPATGQMANAASRPSQLPACPDNGSVEWHDCFGKYVFNSGASYEGEWRENKKHGSGIYLFTNGDRYEGEYADGTRNGVGTFTFADGTRYTGGFKDGDFHGQGTYSFTNGDEYIGTFVNDDFHGTGTFQFASGSRYVGEFKNGLYDGEGSYYFGAASEWAGDSYVGEYRAGERHGQGTYTTADGERFVGEFREGAFHGFGVAYYPDGTVKEGFWDNWEFQDEFAAASNGGEAPSTPTPTDLGDLVSASSGSAFAVSADGYLVTNNHVIEGCQEVLLHTDGQEIPTSLITYDQQNDLALLKAEFRPEMVFPLSEERPELLQDIYVAGYPFGLNLSSSVKVTKGIISSLSGIGNNFSEVQIDAALQSGNSGGPILDDHGNVVGVAVAKLDVRYAIENFGAIPENTNFGIKSSVVANILDSHGVDYPSPNQTEVSKSELGRQISKGTFYISCWMTYAQIEKMKPSKVFFSDLE